MTDYVKVMTDGSFTFIPLTSIENTYKDDNGVDRVVTRDGRSLRLYKEAGLNTEGSTVAEHPVEKWARINNQIRVEDVDGNVRYVTRK